MCSAKSDVLGWAWVQGLVPTTANELQFVIKMTNERFLEQYHQQIGACYCHTSRKLTLIGEEYLTYRTGVMSARTSPLLAITTTQGNMSEHLYHERREKETM